MQITFIEYGICDYILDLRKQQYLEGNKWVQNARLYCKQILKGLT